MSRDVQAEREGRARDAGRWEAPSGGWGPGEDEVGSVER